MVNFKLCTGDEREREKERFKILKLDLEHHKGAWDGKWECNPVSALISG